MKRIITILLFALCVSATSFASDIVGQSAKVAGKDSYKVLKAGTETAGKGIAAAVKALF